ncbi:kunitz-type protease inhibitor 1a [Sardina pilchardus]|uniref:kunitz-type protease inhibitor 1a n=1 Tax=Sardina pilchardus TaxID=27697 RepID=UPI002E1634DD
MTRMTLARVELMFSAVVLLQVFTGSTEAQLPGEQCLTTFKQGKNDFVLDAEESLKDGATFISSPPVTGVNDCIVSCCKHRYCNLALVENDVSTEGSIKACYLFNCLYKQKKVCRFWRKEGFNNYVLTSVFGNYLDDPNPEDEDDRPPIANGGQDRVIQPQETVTLNGLQSKDDKKIVNYQWRMLSGNHAVIEKTTYDDEVMVSNLSSGVYKFQLTVTDDIGQSDSAQVTVLVLTLEQSNHHCLVPKKVGPCRGSFPRWHYNAVTEKCEEFLFGGCKENSNNYLSVTECEKACEGVSVMPGATGRRVPVPVSPVEMCGTPCDTDQFTCANGCCLHPGLECDGEKQCSDGSDENSCTELKDHLSRLLKIKVNEGKARCTEPPVTGPCRASFTKWFYDPYSQSCSRFNFGGCGGNENQFEKEDICINTCQGVTDRDVFARRGKFEAQDSDSDKGPLIIAVLLGVAILVLLVVLGYCFLKGKKKDRQPHHQRVGVNGTHGTTLEDTEKLVYNSTTKPI